MNNNNEVLLKVEHLCQYFKMGSKQLKAVDDVSFEIKKGEVFGLVGESGCGKTTTGRTIIKLYNATSGNVWFKGSRICAGTLSYKEEIKRAREEMRAAVKAYKAEEAKKIAEIASSLDSCREKLSENLDSLEGEWVSDAATKFFESIDDDWKTAVVHYVEMLNELAAQLRFAASTYSPLEDDYNNIKLG